jgi:hypothetical protein
MLKGPRLIGGYVAEDTIAMKKPRMEPVHN